MGSGLPHQSCNVLPPLNPHSPRFININSSREWREPHFIIGIWLDRPPGKSEQSELRLNGPSSGGSALVLWGRAFVARPSPIINQRVNDDDKEEETAADPDS